MPSQRSWLQLCTVPHSEQVVTLGAVVGIYRRSVGQSYRKVRDELVDKVSAGKYANRNRDDI